MLGFDLGHLSTGEIEDLFTEQLQNHHIVLTKALAGATCSDDVTDEGGPVLRPLLLQDLRKHRDKPHVT